MDDSHSKLSDRVSVIEECQDSCCGGDTGSCVDGGKDTISAKEDREPSSCCGGPGQDSSKCCGEKAYPGRDDQISCDGNNDTDCCGKINDEDTKVRCGCCSTDYQGEHPGPKSSNTQGVLSPAPSENFQGSCCGDAASSKGSIKTNSQIENPPCSCCQLDEKPDSCCEAKEESCCDKKNDGCGQEAGCRGGQISKSTNCCSGDDGDACLDEKGGGCCGGKDGGGKGDASCDANKDNCCVDDNFDDTKIEDDSTCSCCIQFLIDEPNFKGPTPKKLLESPGALVAESAIAQSTRIIKACCEILDQYCCQSSCCFVSSTKQMHKDTAAAAAVRPRLGGPMTSTEKVKPPPAIKPRNDTPKGEHLRLEIRGMDCVDCTPKVLRALSQLSSVNNTSIDYFSGIAELRYDPELINPPAIAAFVARATGFGIRPLTDASNDLKGGKATITLPLLFSTIPPPEVFDGFDVRVGSDPHVVEVSFAITQDMDTARRPREVLQNLKTFGAELLPSELGSERNNATRDLITITIRTLASALLSIPVLVLAWADLPHQPVLYGAISVALTTCIQILAFSILSSAFRSIVYLRQIDLSVLVAISTLTAYLFSAFAYAFEVAGKPFSTPFFETSALLITLILAGRTVAAMSRRSTGSTLHDLERLQLNDILYIPARNSAPQVLDARLLYYGDVIRIPPDTRVATDGIVVAGSSDVDESSITGESVAVIKEKGNRVIAGTLNLSGALDVQVTRLVHENSLSSITSLVKQAQSSRLPVQDLADRLSAWILPAATVSACVAFLIWGLVGHFVLDLSATSSSIQALTYMIAIFVVCCPCAIGLSVPLVISRAIGIGLQEGVLFRSSDVLQIANEVTTVVFDKTGTLTQGAFTVERVEIVVKGAEHLIKSLVQDNKHPIAQGVEQYLDPYLDTTLAPQSEKAGIADIVSLPGKGMKASVRGFPLLGGSPSFTGSCEHPIALDLQSSGLSLFSVTLAGQPLAFFGLADAPRPNASALVRELTKRGKQVIIMSGDTPSAVHRVANTIGVPPSNVFAAHTPEDKDSAIAAMQAKGQRVCFVGDGTNDAPALSRAEVSLAMGAGSDVALGAADAVLMGSDLHRGVLGLLDIAAAASMHCYAALAWCVVYNVLAILLASGVFVKVRIEPRWAGIGEVVSVLPVVLIAFVLDVRWNWFRRSVGH